MPNGCGSEISKVVQIIAVNREGRARMMRRKDAARGEWCPIVGLVLREDGSVGALIGDSGGIYEAEPEYAEGCEYDWFEFEWE